MDQCCQFIKWLPVHKFIFVFFVSLLFLPKFIFGKNYKSKYNYLKCDSVTFYTAPEGTKVEVVDGKTIANCYRFYKNIPVSHMPKFIKIIDDPQTHAGGLLVSTSTKNCGIVFFNKKKIVGHISFDTKENYIRFSLSVPAQEKFRIIAGHKKGVAVYSYPIMSGSGATKIRNFSIENHIDLPWDIVFERH